MKQILFVLSREKSLNKEKTKKQKKRLKVDLILKRGTR